VLTTVVSVLRTVWAVMYADAPPSSRRRRAAASFATRSLSQSPSSTFSWK